MDSHGLRAGPAALWFLGPLIALAIWYVYGSLAWVVFHSGQFQGAFSVHALNLIALIYAGIAIWFIAREPWGVLERAFWFSLPASVPLGLIGLVALLIGAVLSIADKPSASDTLKTGFAAICGALLSIFVFWLAGLMAWPRRPRARASAEALLRERAARAARAANSTGVAPPKNRGAVGKRDELGGANEHRTGAKPKPEIQVGDPDADKAVRKPKSAPEVTTTPDPWLASRQIFAADVLSSWDELIKEVPEGALPVEYLSQRTGLARRAVDALRRVRNQCAHPAERGLPEGYELDVALATARELRRRLARKADETG